MMFKRSMLLFISACVVSYSWSGAQDNDRILLSTNPPGATVYLSGPYDIVANAPARLPADITGRFEARITRPGYEIWKGEISFVAGANYDMEIKLSKKTRLKGTMRSLIIPGWGQRYYGETFRGTLLTTGTLAAAAAAYVMDKHYEKRKSEYDLARADYYSATSIEDRLRVKALLDDRQRAAYDAETDRRTILILGAALWTFNVLDALIFFPEQDIFYPTVSSLGDGASVALTARF